MMNLPLPNRLGNSFATANHPSKPAGQSKYVSLGEFIQPLVAAADQRQPWLEDFGNDQIMLPADLYDVIKEFSRLQTKRETGERPD